MVRKPDDHPSWHLQESKGDHKLCDCYNLHEPYRNGEKAKMMPSYSVYCKQRPGEGYRGVVVGVSGTTTIFQDSGKQEEAKRGFYVWPASNGTTDGSGNDATRYIEWCKPSALVLLLMMLVVIFLFISAVLIYFNCKYFICIYYIVFISSSFLVTCNHY